MSGDKADSKSLQYPCLPPFLANKRAIISVKNKDSRSFGYALLSALHPAVKCAYKPKLYEQYFAMHPAIARLTYPIQIAQLAKIEEQLHIPINVYAFSNEGRTRRVVYLSSIDVDAATDLLFWSGHFAWIKSFSGFLSDTNAYGRRGVYCRSCFQCFWHDSELQGHQTLCTSMGASRRAEVPKLALSRPAADNAAKPTAEIHIQADIVNVPRSVEQYHIESVHQSSMQRGSSACRNSTDNFHDYLATVPPEASHQDTSSAAVSRKAVTSNQSYVTSLTNPQSLCVPALPFSGVNVPELVCDQAASNKDSLMTQLVHAASAAVSSEMIIQAGIANVHVAHPSAVGAGTTTSGQVTGMESHQYAGYPFMHLPAFLQKTKAIINVRNTDARSFGYALLSALHPAVHNAHQPWIYERYFARHPRIANLSYPVCTVDLSKTEKQLGIPFNVYTFDDNECRERSTIYLSSINTNTATNLFFWSGHFAWIKSFDRFSHDMNLSHPICCKTCLKHFNTKRGLASHQSHCMPPHTSHSAHVTEIAPNESLLVAGNLPAAPTIDSRKIADAQVAHPPDVRLGSAEVVHSSTPTATATDPQPSENRTLLTELADAAANVKNLVALRAQLNGDKLKLQMINRLQARESRSASISECAHELLIIVHDQSLGCYNYRQHIFMLLTGYGANWWKSTSAKKLRGNLSS